MSKTSLLAPYTRSLIGFEDLFDRLQHLTESSATPNYPPYNILRIDDDTYELEVAVAGFARDELEIIVDRSQLTLKGTKATDQDGPQYLYRGLSSRNFVRTFTLGEYIEIDEASLNNGILSVKLKRVVPEEVKPKTIDIK